MDLLIIVAILLVVGAVSTVIFIRRLKGGAGGCACQGRSSCTQRSSCSQAAESDSDQSQT